MMLINHCKIISSWKHCVIWVKQLLALIQTWFKSLLNGKFNETTSRTDLKSPGTVFGYKKAENLKNAVQWGVAQISMWFECLWHHTTWISMCVTSKICGFLCHMLIQFVMQNPNYCLTDKKSNKLLITMVWHSVLQSNSHLFRRYDNLQLTMVFSEAFTLLVSPFERAV